MCPVQSNNGTGTTLKILRNSGFGVGGNSIFRNGKGFQSKFQSLGYFYPILKSVIENSKGNKTIDRAVLII